MVVERGRDRRCEEVVGQADVDNVDRGVGEERLEGVGDPGSRPIREVVGASGVGVMDDGDRRIGQLEERLDDVDARPPTPDDPESDLAHGGPPGPLSAWVTAAGSSASIRPIRYRPPWRLLVVNPARKPAGARSRPGEAGTPP